jgi:hypothetical protein
VTYPCASGSDGPGWLLTWFLVVPCAAFCCCAHGAEQGETAPPSGPSPNVIYLCREGGQDIHTNTKLNKNCKSVMLGLLPSTNSSAQASAPAKDVSKAPSGFPRISEAVQQARDTDRKRILEEELASEQKNLERAKKELSRQEAETIAGEKNYAKLIERLQPFREEIAHHEQNVRALRKEMETTAK